MKRIREKKRKRSSGEDGNGNDGGGGGGNGTFYSECWLTVTNKIRLEMENSP